MNDTDIIEETPIQIILNRQVRFRAEIEGLLEKRSMEVYHAVKDLTREIRSLKEERDQMKEALLKIEEIYIDGEDTYEDWKKMGTIAQSYCDTLKL